MSEKVNTARFFHQWQGHPIPDISTFHSTALSLRPDKPIIFLAGDSSLDNKFWVPSSSPVPGREPLTVPVPSIYTSALDRPYPKPDVAFWLNHFLAESATALNLAVEASTLKDREKDLLEHDAFIRDHIRAQDILIVSIGANDIALRPTFATIRHMLQLAWLTPHSSLQKGTAWALPHFTHMFKTQIETYISRLVSRQKPRAVIVCMIYFPLESAAQKSWADLPLKVLGYNRSPGQLQAAIEAMYELATKKIEVKGARIVPCRLSEVLDGKREGDYTDRVEPSSEGGRKMAEMLRGIVDSLGEG